MQVLQDAVIRKLERLEEATNEHVEFWLHHQRFLDPRTSSIEKLEFLMPGRVTSPEWKYTTECECCHEINSVYLESRTDTYICNECGMCQDKERKIFQWFVPESSIYKHSVHLHQILHEMQCLRHAIPDNLILDVRDAIKPPYTYHRIKKSLRALGYKQHYSMVYSIQQRLDPMFKPLVLSHEQERRLKGLFFQYIALGKLEGRKNRLNYHFVLSKLATMCDFHFLHPYLHPPKGKKAVSESERIWATICKRLNWPYQLNENTRSTL